MKKLEDKIEEAEDRILMWFAYTLFFPFVIWNWIADRHFYRTHLAKIKVGDYFVVDKDTEYLKANKLYEVRSLNNGFINFKNERTWGDKIHVSKVRKAIFL